MAFDADYYNHMQRAYRQRRDVLMTALVQAGFSCSAPDGAYYVLADFSAIDSGRNDREFAVWLAESIGVATVPGTSFYGDAGRGTAAVRFAFCKTFETLGRAAERLEALHR